MLFVLSASAQKSEFSAGVTGNLYNYGGTVASHNVYSYTTVYSKMLTPGVGLQADFKLIEADGFMMGIGGGYDELRSKATQLLIYVDYFPVGATSFAGNYSTGYVTTRLKELYASPYFGYRLIRKHYSVDFTLGADVAFLVENQTKQETGSGSSYSTSTTYQSNKYVGNENTDYRVKFGVGFNYRRFGINANYAHGFANLRRDMSYYNYPQTGSAYSQVIKLGVNYRIF